MPEERRLKIWDDGIHFTPLGYDILGDALGQYIVTLLRSEDTIHASTNNEQRRICVEDFEREALVGEAAETETVEGEGAAENKREDAGNKEEDVGDKRALEANEYLRVWEEEALENP